MSNLQLTPTAGLKYHFTERKLMPKEYIIYADESIGRGEYYSDFYGGVLVTSDDIELITKMLEREKVKQNMFDEIKWSKVTANYLEKYMAVMDTFFNFVKRGRVKVRIMFTQNIHIPVNLKAYHLEYKYHLLYYQFIKHAFGLRYSNRRGNPINLRIYLDKLPDTKEKNAMFKAHIQSLARSQQFRDANIRIKYDQIAEIISHDHVLLQCLDIVLGAMQFRLNDKHKAKIPGKRFRGKRTIAKENLYKHILKRIQEIYPNFNIGISTGRREINDTWLLPYRHWKFVPKDFTIDNSKSKP